jgi:hypothetical protein
VKALGAATPIIIRLRAAAPIHFIVLFFIFIPSLGFWFCDAVHPRSLFFDLPRRERKL